MEYQIRVVDVFTEKPLAGNQLAVVLGADGMPGDVMQRVAKEMNLAETTFVLKPEHPDHAARVRIFTPGTELPFAGHPTVGTAWVLSTEGLVPGGALDFTLEEGVGPVPVRGVHGPHGLRFWMTHPTVSFGEVIAGRASFAAAIGVSEDDLLPEVPIQVAKTGLPFVYVALKDAAAVDSAVSSKERLADAFGDGERFPVFISAPIGRNVPRDAPHPDGGREHRLYSRMFAPHVFDIQEDPATGSGSGPLGAFAVKYGLIPRSAAVSVVSEQGTKMGRQSFVHIELTYPPVGDIPSTIEVGGSVVPVIRGVISVS